MLVQISSTDTLRQDVCCIFRSWDFGQLVNPLGSERCLDPEASSLQVTDLTTTTPLANCQNKWWRHSNKQGSNTIPLRNRSDFKQAFSTLERLEQEGGEEPYVPTYSYKHKQWQLPQSSSFIWWNWQDSWWSSYNSESQGGGEQKSRMNGETRYL